MKILILALNGYPTENDLYKGGFIHQRVLGYNKAGNECIVFSVAKDSLDYEYEGVTVFQRTMTSLSDIYKLVKPDILFTHFVNRHYIKWMIVNDITIPQVIWVHGFEALSWRRRLFTFTFSTQFIKFVLANTKKRFIWNRSWNKNKEIWQNASFIFVSEWMKGIAEKDLGFKFNNSCIIPNPVNHDHFNFRKYDDKNRLKCLLIRSFDSKKYATDIAIKGIEKLSHHEDFSQFTFTIYGKGKLFEEQTNLIKHFDNVTLHNNFVNQSEIPSIHQKHGIFLCPTRQDAQGVTMCEAMSSGLTVIASDNTAIPEYMPEDCGYKINTPKQLSEMLIYIKNNPKEAHEFAENGSQFIKIKCNYDQIIADELDLALNTMSDAKSDIIPSSNE